MKKSIRWSFRISSEEKLIFKTWAKQLGLSFSALMRTAVIEYCHNRGIYKNEFK